MRTFLFFLGIILLIAAGLFIKHHIDKNKSDSREKNAYIITDSVVTKTDNLLEPDLFTEIVDKDSNFVAGVFHDKFFSRQITGIYTEYLDPNTPSDYVYTEKEFPGTVFYVLNNNNRLTNFYKKTKNIASKEFSYTDSSGTYPALIYKNCVFVKLGYRLSDKGFVLRIYSTKDKVTQKPKIARKQKDDEVFEHDLSTGVIDDSDGYTNLRQQPNSSSDIVMKIYNGTKFDVISKTENWFQIKLADGATGYVYISNIKLD